MRLDTLHHDTVYAWRYRRLLEPMLPVVYVPFLRSTPTVRCRRERMARSSCAHPVSAGTVGGCAPSDRDRRALGFRVSHVRTQIEIDRSHTMRERLLALLAAFFAATALLLAGIGLFGVLHHAVASKRREIAIRVALGATIGDVARRVTVDVSLMICAGVVLGLALGATAQRHIETLLYDVSGSELTTFLRRSSRWRSLSRSPHCPP
jgi:putative ABC transport system permease protein